MEKKKFLKEIWKEEVKMPVLDSNEMNDSGRCMKAHVMFLGNATNS